MRNNTLARNFTASKMDKKNFFTGLLYHTGSFGVNMVYVKRTGEGESSSIYRSNSCGY